MPDSWRKIEDFVDPGGMEHYMLWNGNRVFPGWLDDDGWHDVGSPEHQDYPTDPQPTHFMDYPTPPEESSNDA